MSVQSVTERWGDLVQNTLANLAAEDEQVTFSIANEYVDHPCEDDEEEVHKVCCLVIFFYVEREEEDFCRACSLLLPYAAGIDAKEITSGIQNLWSEMVFASIAREFEREAEPDEEGSGR